MSNPFRPGAGHQPPYLAGRTEESTEFKHLLSQDVVLQNVILTGLRGIGKTVLLESFRPLAHRQGWLWAGTDCSESASVTEETMAVRLLTDIALIASGIKVKDDVRPGVGFAAESHKEVTYLNFDFLVRFYQQTPGLASDKLKQTLEFVWQCLSPLGVRGIVFAYDEAQTLSDHAKEKQYPLSLLLDVFQSMQKRNIPFMLVLTGLPTLLTHLVETRTYSERLFRVLVIERLNREESREAIVKPMAKSGASLSFDDRSIELIVNQSGGYPFFIQFMCREVFDVFEQQITQGEKPAVPIDAILQKLDNDFFAGRWAKATDREKELLSLLAHAGLVEFTIAQAAKLSQDSETKPFSGSQINQMFGRLIENGLVYKDRRGSYSFAVPLLEGYITRLDRKRLQA
jgi:hypothetical protein